MERTDRPLLTGRDSPAGTLPRRAPQRPPADAGWLGRIPPVPPEVPLSMPAQDFRAAPPSGPAREPATARVLAARLIAFGGAALITAIGFWQMLIVFSDGIQPLQWALLVFFTLTFGWVGFSFCSLIAGLVARPPVTPADPGTARVAIVMPIYHEDPADSMGMLGALADQLAEAGMSDRAEIFILSDSRDPDFFATETLAVAALRDTCPLPVWYRRRTDNTGRKAGNIAEFVRRWGGRRARRIDAGGEPRHVELDELDELDEFGRRG